MSAAAFTALLKFWSVTVLIREGLGSGRAITNWIADTVATAGVDEHEVVEVMLRRGDRDGAIRHLVNKRWQTETDAKQRGTDFHTAAEQLALGIRPTVSDLIAPYMEQYERWLERMRPRFLMAEAPVYNTTYQYAGTLDGIIELAGRPFLFDLKTTDRGPDSDKSRPPYPEVALQCAAYAHAELVGVISEQRYAGGKRYYLFNPEDKHEPMPPVEGALAIIVSPYDCFAVPTRIDDAVWRAFLHALNCARWQLETSRHVFGAPLTALPAHEPVA